MEIGTARTPDRAKKYIVLSAASQLELELIVGDVNIRLPDTSLQFSHFFFIGT